MITGYFYRETIESGQVKKQIVKVLKMIILSNLFFFVMNGLIALTKGEIGSFLGKCFSIKAIGKFLVLNESPMNGHLWYLGALFCVLAIMATVDKMVGKSSPKMTGGGYRILYILIPFLFVGDLVIGKYSILLFGREFPYVLVKNWLFVGLPYFLIGDWIYKLRTKNKCKLNKSTLIILIVLFAITTILERYILVVLNANATRDHYISTTFLAITLFLMFLDTTNSWVKTGKRGRLVHYLAVVGRKYSTMIYIIHPVFIRIYGVIIRKISETVSFLETVYCWMAPLLVFVSSLVFAVIWDGIVGMKLYRTSIK